MRSPKKELILEDDPRRVSTDIGITFSGGGGLTGTTQDYAKFRDMLRQGGTANGYRSSVGRPLNS